MTRSELVQKLIQSNHHLTVAQAEKSITVILDEITSALAKGNRVELRGFGVFTTRSRRSRLGRNPRTGDPVKVDPKRVPFFKTGKQLRDRLNRH
ncbi:MAG: integration host factor subunit beta [Caedimonas sp.]|nr:integration host factor subunit beta [Caedimonas sp.]